MTLAKANPE